MSALLLHAMLGVPHAHAENVLPTLVILVVSGVTISLVGKKGAK